MFSQSSQANQWIFKSIQDLAEMREEANSRYISETTGKESLSPEDFLTPEEEKLLCKHMESTLRDFCRKFQPPMPKNVVGTAFHYFKRFYLNNSVMDYHPKHIVLLYITPLSTDIFIEESTLVSEYKGVTCAFLACKVEEFNVSIVQFVANVKGDRAKAKEIILNHELLLMQQLNYDLSVHLPYRAVEGYLIDMKARCPEISDPERFRPAIEEFLDLICFTDAFLLYSPSQIALAAVAFGARKFNENIINNYVTKVLFSNGPESKIAYIKECIKRMWTMITNREPHQKDKIKMIEKKLEKCRNEENNPNSTAYKRKMEEMLEEEELEQNRKYARVAEESKKEERKVLGMDCD